jgi:hypothetical protein
MVSELRRIAWEKGRPITKMDLFGHGFPGGLAFAEGRDAVQSTEKMDGVFAAGAKVRFMSCMTGSGAEGDEFLRAFGKSFLTRGGEVATSQVLMQANYAHAYNRRLGFNIKGLPASTVHWAIEYGAPIAPTLVPAAFNGYFQWKYGEPIRPWSDLYVFRNRVKRMTFGPASP